MTTNRTSNGTLVIQTTRAWGEITPHASGGYQVSGPDQTTGGPDQYDVGTGTVLAGHPSRYGICVHIDEADAIACLTHTLTDKEVTP